MLWWYNLSFIYVEVGWNENYFESVYGFDERFDMFEVFLFVFVGCFCFSFFYDEVGYCEFYFLKVILWFL